MKLSQHLTLNFNHSQFVSILPEPSLIKNLGEVFPGTNPGHAMGQRRGEECGCAGFWNQSTLEIKPVGSAQDPPPANSE